MNIHEVLVLADGEGFRRFEFRRGTFSADSGEWCLDYAGAESELFIRGPRMS